MSPQALSTVAVYFLNVIISYSDKDLSSTAPADALSHVLTPFYNINGALSVPLRMITPPSERLK